MNRMSYQAFIMVIAFASSIIYKTAWAQEDKNWPRANATVLNEVSVYLYKPKYTGLFGLGSLFTNKLEVVLANYRLPKGARIRLLEKWDTGARGYRYVKFQWIKEGKITDGWTWAGKRPSYWIMIKPDNEATPFADPISSYNTIIKKQHYVGFFELLLSIMVTNAHASDVIGVPILTSGDGVESQAPGREPLKERGAINFFSLIWTSSFVTTVSFAKDSVRERFRDRFRNAFIYYSITFAGITFIGFLEAIVVKVMDARFFGG